MYTACDTPIQRYFRFVQVAAFAMRKRNETPFFYAQMKTRNYSLQAEWANLPQPTGCNETSQGQLQAVDFKASQIFPRGRKVDKLVNNFLGLLPPSLPFE